VATPGELVDYDFIKRELRELREAGVGIREIAYDQAGATATANDLRKDGFTMVEFGQGFKSMSEPAKNFEALIVARRVLTGGNPVLTWCVSNAVAKMDEAGNIKPDKKRSAEKIDGVVAAIMALGRLDAEPEEEESGSYLETSPMVSA
jgi:phage terminase large subunit-like protein